MCAFTLNTKSTKEGLIWHKFILNIWALILLISRRDIHNIFLALSSVKVKTVRPTLFYLSKLFTKIWI